MHSSKPSKFGAIDSDLLAIIGYLNGGKQTSPIIAHISSARCIGIDTHNNGIMFGSGRRLPSRLVVVAGTYDGVLAGWDTETHAASSVNGGDTATDAADAIMAGINQNADPDAYLKMSFAMAVHEGSVRCLSMSSAPASSAPTSSKKNSNENEAEKKKKRKKKRRKHHEDDGSDSDGDDEDASTPSQIPGTLLSGGYDESIHIFNLIRHVQSGELRSAADLGTPTCSSFAPPPTSPSPATHALVGMSSGKIVLYKKRDWSVQHVLSGHDGEHGGVNCLAVHPTGKMALSGGRSDGKIILWDLMRGRLAFVHKLPPAPGSRGKRKATLTDLAWSADGQRYAFATDGGKVTARDVNTGEDLLDVMLPSRANQIAFIGGPEGLFLAAACDDGSLPVLAVGSLSDETEEAEARRAVMAIEPVDGPVAGDARFKCLKSVEGGSGFLVVTANSGGVVSLIDLEGAARMILSDDEEGGRATGGGSSDEDDDVSDEDEEEDVAADFLESVRIGSGARITNLAVWSAGSADGDGMGDDDYDMLETTNDAMYDEQGAEDDYSSAQEGEEDESIEEAPAQKKKQKIELTSRISGEKSREIELDAEALEKARSIIKKAKKKQKKAKKKKSKNKD